MQVVDMVLGDVLYTKVLNDEDKEDGALFVAPKARSGGILIVTRCVEANFEEIVGNHTRLGYAIYAFADIEVYPYIMDITEQIILLDKFIRYVGEFDTSIFGVCNGAAKGGPWGRC